MRIIDALPEPTEKHAGVHVPHVHREHPHPAPLMRTQNLLHRRVARAVEDNDVDSSEEFVTTAAPVKHHTDHHFTYGTQASAEVAAGQGLTWQQFKEEVVRVVEKTIDNAGRE